jgi:hypothetical protein
LRAETGKPARYRRMSSANFSTDEYRRVNCFSNAFKMMLSISPRSDWKSYFSVSGFQITVLVRRGLFIARRFL